MSFILSLEYIFRFSTMLSKLLAFISIVFKYLSSFSGVLAIPSFIPSTYPFIEVIGVFKSWDIFAIVRL